MYIVWWWCECGCEWCALKLLSYVYAYVNPFCVQSGYLLHSPLRGMSVGCPQ